MKVSLKQIQEIAKELQFSYDRYVDRGWNDLRLATFVSNRIIDQFIEKNELTKTLVDILLQDEFIQEILNELKFRKEQK